MYLTGFYSKPTNILYSELDWPHIYTDGSCLNNDSAAGAGIHCKLFSL